MQVYRIAKSRYSADLSGEGARLFGGRWNHVGTPCLYSSESRALALLEFSVHLNLHDMPRHLRTAIIQIPDKNIYTLSPSELPANWMESPAPASTKDLGTKLLNTLDVLVIRVPSTIIPQEYNYLINPRHRDARQIQLISEEELVYDARIKIS